MNLPIFPEGALASSVITTVWVGVFVIAFFNLRFGWVLSGLVVPGYIVPLLIVRPIAATVITFEAILTYLLVWLFSEKFGGRWWSSLFGRDRFFALVLASIAVRAGLDGWALPRLADWLATSWDRQFDWQSNLQSFGLVVISLMANQLWKPGLARGLGSMIVVTGLSWLIVRYGLMEFTNFRISGVSYLYEGLASSMLASPKAYMILVITAMLASHMNVRYGWDFSGILIPALIALQWYQPAKIISSFIEATAIYLLARMLLKLPFLANASMEGARKLLYFFNVSFIYKLIIGHAITFLALDVKISDYYGFGYLLSTLIAIKAHDKDIFPRVMRSTLEVSFAGAVLGNLAGFMLTAIAPVGVASAVARAGKADGGSGGDIERLIQEAIGSAYVRRAEGGSRPLSADEAEALRATIEQLDAGADPAMLATWLSVTGFEMRRDSAGLVAIARKGDGGRDLLLFNPGGRRRLGLVVEDPTRQPGLAVAAYRLFQLQDARWLLITAPVQQRAAAVQTMLGSYRAASRVPELAISAQASLSESRGVFVRRSAIAVNLAVLRRELPGVTVAFSAVVLRPGEDTGTLTLAARDIARLAQSSMAKSPDRAGEPAAKPSPLPVALPADTHAARSADNCLVQSASGAPMPQSVERLAYLRFEVVEPLLAFIAAKSNDAGAVPRSAALAGFTLDRCQLAGRLQWRLAARDRSLGTMLLDPQGDPGQVIQSYHDPKRYTMQAAGTFYRTMQAGALLIAPDQDSLIEGPQSPVNMVAQVMLRRMGSSPGSVVQVREVPPTSQPRPALRGAKPSLQADAIIATDWVEPSSAFGSRLMVSARQAGYRPMLGDRSQFASGYETTTGSTFRYLEQSIGKRFAIIWIAPAALPANPGSISPDRSVQRPVP